MTDLARQKQAAVDALVYRLNHREPGVDHEPFAQEYVESLWGFGWRPTPLTDRPAARPPASKETKREIVEALRAERGWDQDSHTPRGAA